SDQTAKIQLAERRCFLCSFTAAEKSFRSAADRRDISISPGFGSKPIRQLDLSRASILRYRGFNVLESGGIGVALFKEVINAYRHVQVLVQVARKQGRVGHKIAAQLDAGDRRQAIRIPAVEGSGKLILRDRQEQADLCELLWGIRGHLVGRKI